MYINNITRENRILINKVKNIFLEEDNKHKHISDGLLYILLLKEKLRVVENGKRRK